MSANDKQVGGSHYSTASGRQHWDFVVENELNYFEGQITKYVARCRKKNGMEDLKKAMHFLEKYMEVYSKIVLPPPEQKARNDRNVAQGAILGAPYVWNAAADWNQSGVALQEQWQAAAGQQIMEQASPVYQSDAFFLAEGGFGSGMNLYTCRQCRQQVYARGLLEARLAHTHAPAGTQGA